MEDIEEAARKIRLLAEVIGEIEGSARVEDPAVQAQLKQLDIEMSSYSRQLSLLSNLLTMPKRPVITRPVLHLVKG